MALTLHDTKYTTGVKSLTRATITHTSRCHQYRMFVKPVKRAAVAILTPGPQPAAERSSTARSCAGRYHRHQARKPLSCSPLSLSLAQYLVDAILDESLAQRCNVRPFRFRRLLYQLPFFLWPTPNLANRVQILLSLWLWGTTDFGFLLHAGMIGCTTFLVNSRNLRFLVCFAY